MAQQLQKLFTRLFVGGMSLSVGAFTLSQSLYVVEPGYRAVIWDRGSGMLANTKGEGMHFRIPFWQKVRMLSVRKTPKNIHTQTGSKDLQEVKISLRVLYRPDKKKLSQLYDKYGSDYDERFLPSLGNEVLKAVVAQYDAGELITQREVVSREIREQLTEKSKMYSIVLDDVSITHLSFSEEFTRAIEQKQVASQEAERAKFVVEKAEQEKKASVIRAEGESEAARLITEATTLAGPALIELRRLEAAKEVAETLSKSKNVTYLPSSGQIGSDGQSTGGSNLLLGLTSGRM
jgi:prohibitin 1